MIFFITGNKYAEQSPHDANDKHQKREIPQRSINEFSNHEILCLIVCYRVVTGFSGVDSMFDSIAVPGFLSSTSSFFSHSSAH